jgi:hypothetical protein
VSGLTITSDGCRNQQSKPLALFLIGANLLDDFSSLSNAPFGHFFMYVGFQFITFQFGHVARG